MGQIIKFSKTDFDFLKKYATAIRKPYTDKHYYSIDMQYELIGENEDGSAFLKEIEINIIPVEYVD